MKKLVIAAIVTALFSASAHAQQDKGPPTARTEKQMKEDKEIDKAYQDAMKKTGDKGQAAKTDPWQTIRPAGTDNTKR
jgi:Ni/Co efflux regulator RcnB